MRMKRKKFVNPFRKTIDIHLNIDTDRDGVKDYLDCRPFNYWKQDDVQFFDNISTARKQITELLVEVHNVPRPKASKIVSDIEWIYDEDGHPGCDLNTLVY